MSVGLSETSKVILEQDYDPLDIKNTIRMATSWAEERRKQLTDRYTELLPWRSKTGN